MTMTMMEPDDIGLIGETVVKVCAAFDDDYWSDCDRNHRFSRAFLRPRAQAAADAALAEAMEEQSAEVFAQTLEHLASKQSGRRRKPSA